MDPTTGAAELATIVEAIIPTIKDAIRTELQAIKPLDEAWYHPSEIEALSCGRVRAGTIRNWLSWGQIDGESDGREVRIYQSTVEELRQTSGVPRVNPPIEAATISKERQKVPESVVMRGLNRPQWF